MLRLKLFTGVVLLFLSFIVEAKLRALFGWAPDITLALIISYVFYFSFIEFLFFLVTAIFLLNWQPFFGIEIWVFAGISLAVFLLKRLLPWQAWLQNSIAIVVGIIVFYVFSYSVNIVPIGRFLLQNILFSALWGNAVFYILSRFYHQQI